MAWAMAVSVPAAELHRVADLSGGDDLDAVSSVIRFDLVKAPIDGRLPRGIGVARLFDAPVAWSRQQQVLGFTH
jgi:hypothetical protein